MIALLLALCMVLAWVPVTASAEEVASGTCGNNVTWVLTENGALTISGTGNMWNYSYGYFAPWFSYRESITSAVICDGITNIGDYAFHNCNKLTSIDIPEGVTSIGKYAFSRCAKLTSIDIPDSVTSIGERAFHLCSRLTSINIPDGVTSIESLTFYKCSRLTSIDIPDGVTIIASQAFSDCYSLTNITIPDSVTHIGVSAFYLCSGLTTVTISNSVTRIENCTFYSCSSLTSITIPASVKEVGVGAFDQCGELTEVYFIGDAPTFDPPSSDYEIFAGVTATCYYPKNNPTWTADVMQDYGGDLTWVAVDPCAKGHSYDTEVTAPTCTEQGYTTYTCSVCGDSYVGSYVDANGHSYGDWYTLAEATCTEKGLESRNCANCDHSETRSTELADHSYDTVVTAPTCTAQGYTTYTCTACGDTYTGDYTDPAPHTPGEIQVENEIPATCTATGSYEAVTYCTVCGIELKRETVETEIIPHSYESTEVEATCTEPGGILHTCAVCEHEHLEVETEALGHTFEDGYCTVCGASERMPGDLNGDGEVDIFDANLIVAFYNGTADLSAEQQLAADVNGDGEVDIFDANLVVSYYNGTIDKFPIEE